MREREKERERASERNTCLYQLLFHSFQKAWRSCWQSLQKDFLSSFSSTSITAVASGKCNFCLINAHPIQCFYKRPNKKTKQKKKMVKTAMNQTQFTSLEYPNKKKSTLATWRHLTNSEGMAKTNKMNPAGCCFGFPTRSFPLLYQQLHFFSHLAASHFLDRNFTYLFYI